MEAKRARGLGRIRTGIDGLFFAVVAFLGLFFLVGLLGAATTSSLVGFCGCAITSGAFGSMKPTIRSTRRPWPGLTGS